MLPLLKSSSHYLGETAIRIDSYPAGWVFLALTQANFARAALGHLYHNLGLSHGSDQRRIPRDDNLPGSEL